MIKLSNISQTYLQGQSKIVVLENLNLQLSKSKSIGIIGPSGSGKSTLLNILGLIETPCSGEYFLNGQDCLKLNNNLKTEIRKQFIGYIFQNNQLLEDFNVIDNIALPLILRGEHYLTAKKKSSEFLKNLNLEKKSYLKPGLLSGGEQQRIAIARALIKNPLLLLADEPTGSLDKENSDLIVELMLNLSKKNNTTTIIATHNLDLINKLDLCLKIEKGKLIEFN